MKWRSAKRWSVITCVVCNLGQHPDDVQFDHEQALCDGGSHEVENLRPVCKPCHARKSAFEHKRNSKSKRIAKAREVHEAVLRGEHKREPSKIGNRGWPKGWRKRMNGKVERV